MSYGRLLSIDLKHEYYEDGRCRDVTVVPAVETAVRLRNHRCVAKPRPGGLDIYVETEPEGLSKIPFPADSALSFDLRVGNPAFIRFTEPPALPIRGSDYELIQPDRQEAGYLAQLRVRRDFNRVQDAAVEIQFSVKSAFWIYYLLTQPSADGAEFAIALRNGQTADWQRPDGTDPILEQLADRYPGVRRLRFVSGQPIPCRESGLKNVQLLLGGNTVIEHLPNPSWRNRLQVQLTEKGGEVDAIFHVINRLTRSTLTKV